MVHATVLLLLKKVMLKFIFKILMELLLLKKSQF